jgi:hypothetical protein
VAVESGKTEARQREEWNPMTLEEVLAEASADLTERCTTTQDVAAKLKTARCEGKRGNPLECPLAKWFAAALRERRALPRRHVVSVDGTTWGRTYLFAHVRKVAGRGPDICPPLPMPALLVEFANNFDNGSFPDLTA